MIARLKPWATALAVILTLILALAAAHGLGLRWDPFDLAGRRLRAAEARADLAKGDAAARRLEQAGEAEQRARLDHHHQQTLAVARATERAAAEARSAHDADLPLDPARAARIGEHDRRLCDLNPAVCASAAPDPAAGRDNALPSCCPAVGPDRRGLGNRLPRPRGGPHRLRRRARAGGRDAQGRARDTGSVAAVTCLVKRG